MLGFGHPVPHFKVKQKQRGIKDKYSSQFYRKFVEVWRKSLHCETNLGNDRINGETLYYC